MSTLDAAAVDRFLAEDPDAPVVMLNLLRFVPDGGAEKYFEYIGKFGATGVQQRYGVEIVYGGMGATPWPATGEAWDMVALVRYPSRRHFAEMIVDPDYLEFEHLRTEAVSAAVLQPTTPAVV